MILLFLLQVFHPLIYANIFRLNPIHSENIQHLLAAKYRVSIFMAHAVSQKGIEIENDGEEDKAIEATSWCIFGSWRGKPNTHIFSVFSICLCWRQQQLVEALALNLWVGREKCPVVLLIPICGSFCCHLRFKGVFPPYLFIKSIPIRQQIIPQKPRVSLYFRPKMQRQKGRWGQNLQNQIDR